MIICLGGNFSLAFLNRFRRCGGFGFVACQSNDESMQPPGAGKELPAARRGDCAHLLSTITRESSGLLPVLQSIDRSLDCQLAIPATPPSS
jgi:hypothetical protein